jgi:hypothetical protein
VKHFIMTLCLIISACSTYEHIQIIPFDDNIQIVVKNKGSGGALGNDTYQVFYRYRGEDRIFFEGRNPGEFKISKTGPNLIEIRFCDGTVHLAQPIFVAPPSPYKELIHLNLDLACRGNLPL